MKNFVSSIFRNIRSNIVNKNSQVIKDSQIFQNYNFIGNYKLNAKKVNKINLETTKNYQKQYDDCDIDNIKIINIETSDFKYKVQNKLEITLTHEADSINTIINKETDESCYNEINSILNALNENKEENLFSSNEEEIKKIDHEETEISRNEIESVLNNLNEPRINRVKIQSFKNINQETIKPLSVYQYVLNNINHNKLPETNQKINRPQNPEIRNRKPVFKKIEQPTLYEEILKENEDNLLNNKKRRPYNHPNKEREDFSLYSKINTNKPIEKQETLASKENERENKHNIIPYLNKFISQKEMPFNRIEPIRLSRIKIQNSSKNYCESEFFKKLLKNQKDNINIRYN